MHKIDTMRKTSCLGPSLLEPSGFLSAQMVRTPIADSTPTAARIGQLVEIASRCQRFPAPRVGAITARDWGLSKLIV